MEDDNVAEDEVDDDDDDDDDDVEDDGVKGEDDDVTRTFCASRRQKNTLAHSRRAMFRENLQ